MYHISISATKDGFQEWTTYFNVKHIDMNVIELPKAFIIVINEKISGFGNSIRHYIDLYICYLS